MTDERSKVEKQLEEVEEAVDYLGDISRKLEEMTADIEEMMSTAGIFGVDDYRALGAFRELGFYQEKVDAKLREYNRDVRHLEEELRDLEDNAETDDLAELLEAS